MSMNYPELDLKQIEAILRVVESAGADASYLNPENCPYDRKTVNRLKKVIEACQLNSTPAPDRSEEKRGRGRPSKNQVVEVDEVERELDDLRREMSQMKIDQKALPTAERVAIFRVRASIVERMIAMKERVINMKQQLSFINTVIQIMEEELDQQQREKLIKRLKPFAEGE